MKPLLIKPASEWTSGAEGFFKLSEEVYRKAEGLNQSVLKYGVDNPQLIVQAIAEPLEPSAAMEIGSLVHIALLEPERFGDGLSHYIRPPTYDGPKGEVKRWSGNATVCREWMESHDDKPILSPKDLEKVSKMAASFNRDPMGQMFAENGHKEIACFVRDEETGLMLKMKMDLIAEEDGFAPDDPTIYVADLKKTWDGSEHGFSTAAAERRLDVQLGMGIWMVSKLLEVPPGNVRFLHASIEDSGNYFTRWLELDDPVDRESGIADFRRAVTGYAEAMVTGEFRKITKVQMPRWFRERR